MNRHEGISPYKYQNDLENSGIALLKKTSALLKNPNAGSNYKVMNFECEDWPKDSFDQHNTTSAMREARQSFDPNTIRKGVMFNLYKNKALGLSQERKPDHQNRMHESEIDRRLRDYQS